MAYVRQVSPYFAGENVRANELHHMSKKEEENWLFYQQLISSFSQIAAMCRQLPHIGDLLFAHFNLQNCISFFTEKFP